MTNISRSVYQKVVEENKSLKADLYIITMGHISASVELQMKWRNKFEQDAAFAKTMKELAVQYIESHPELHWIKDLGK